MNAEQFERVERARGLTHAGEHVAMTPTIERPAIVRQSAADYLGAVVATAEAGTLLPLILGYERARDVYNATPSDHPDDPRLEREFHAAFTALRHEILELGVNAVSLDEAKSATRLAAREYQEDNEFAAGLALAALAVFLGEEAVS